MLFFKLKRLISIFTKKKVKETNITFKLNQSFKSIFKIFNLRTFKHFSKV